MLVRIKNAHKVGLLCISKRKRVNFNNWTAQNSDFCVKITHVGWISLFWSHLHSFDDLTILKRATICIWSLKRVSGVQKSEMSLYVSDFTKKSLFWSDYKTHSLKSDIVALLRRGIVELKLYTLKLLWRGKCVYVEHVFHFNNYLC